VPKPRARTAYHHGDLANALVRVALTLVEHDGVDQFSLRAAAARCGVAVSAAYKHFADRDALLRAVAELGFVSLGARMVECVATVTRGRRGKRRAELALVELGRTYILFAIERPKLFRLMYGPLYRADATQPDSPARRLGMLLVQAISDVMRAYGHAPAKLEANMVIAWALVHGFAMMVVEGLWPQRDVRALHAMIAELGDAVLRSLR
jgi:AcrR family transcriptional regulator